MNFKRCLMLVGGLIIFALGISVTIVASLGASPWDAVCVGLHKLFGMTIGFWINVESLLLICVGGLLGKEIPKLQCLLSSAIIGVFVDIFIVMFVGIEVVGIFEQLLLFLLGVSIISLGCGTYLSVDVLPCAIDYFMLSIGKRYNKGIAFSMTMCEGVGLILALIFQGPVGFGTIISIFIYGPMINFFFLIMKRSHKLSVKG